VLVGLGFGAAAAAWLFVAGAAGWLGPATGPVAGGGWTDRSRAWFTHRGFYATDIDAEGRRSTWTGDGVRLVSPSRSPQAHRHARSSRCV
jgi:hypothetical protein